jgi:hypothetical protein
MNDFELKQAYSILGLPDDASMDDVDKRYMLLLKKQHTQQAREAEEATREHVSVDYQQVNQAFRLIRQHYKEQASLAFEQQYYSATHRKWKLDKLDHFWQFNKFRIISIVLILAVVAYGVGTFLDKRAERIALSKLPPADIEIMFYGDYYSEDIPKLEQVLLEQMPDWKRVVITITQVPNDFTSPYAVSLQQKAVIMLMTVKPDMYVMDKSTFEILSQQQILLDANNWLGPLEGQLTEEQKLFGQGDTDSEPRIYGVDVSQNAVFESKGLHSVDQIMGLRFDSTKQEAARQLVQLYLSKLDSH